MNINPELIARAYAIYEFYFGLREEVSSADEGSFRSSKPAFSDNDLKDFLEKLKALDDDEEGSGGDTQKGLRGDEQMREMRSLKMGGNKRPM